MAEQKKNSIVFLMLVPNTGALKYQLSNDYGTEDHEYLLEAVLCIFSS